MRHLRAGRKLGRNATHRLAMYRNLTMALIRHERIITTVEKAKAVRPFVEKIITLAKRGTLHARRLVIARLGPPSSAEVRPINDADIKNKVVADERTIVQKLFDDVGPRFKDRPGGYTRIVKRHKRRLGDGGETAILQLLQAGETKVQTRAPAPRIEEQPAPQPVVAPTPEQPQQEPAAQAEATPQAAETPVTPAAEEKPAT